MVDEMVLAAQRWVNSRYGTVNGYNRCAEDGKTGWQTMYALTRALQHELGITALSNNFGPGTVAALTARGGIKRADANANIISLAKCAFYCKGYFANGVTGSLPESTVSRFFTDLGIADTIQNLDMPATVVKALFTMDAYVIVSGGKATVREVQQWLNRTYWKKSWGALVPCDGHFSRSVQVQLMKAIQSQIGIPDGSVNGTFGPSTKEKLAQSEVSMGDSGRLVELFSAACVFNGDVLFFDENGGESSVSISKRSVFDIDLRTYVDRFQRFTLLHPAESGRGTYDTWCELLVSTGNPDREVTACDTRFKFTEDLARTLRSRGYITVGRYLDEVPGKLPKKLEEGEPQAILDGGMQLFPIWQLNAREPSDFSFEKGRTEGSRALERLEHFRFPRAAVCYFAVDLDATDPVITSNVIPYFKGVQSAFSAAGRKYRVGVYGSRNVCSRVSKEAGAVASFLAGMSWGFSGNLGFPLPENWAFNQIQELSDLQVGNRTIDLDRTAHRASVDPGVSRLDAEVSPPFEAAEAYITFLYEAALDYGAQNPNIAVLDFLRHPAYTGVSEGWPVFLAPTDEAWINFASEAIPARNRLLYFNDPATGQRLSLDHIAAAILGLIKFGPIESPEWNGGDFGGWLGDLTTFYVEWRNNYDSNRSGREYCLRNLAQPSVRSSFGLPDFIEDADALQLGMEWSNDVSIADQMSSYYGSSDLHGRFDRFLGYRFSNDPDQIRETARAGLIDAPDGSGFPLALRTGLIVKRGHTGILQPALLPSEQLEGFLDGFAEVVVALSENW